MRIKLSEIYLGFKNKIFKISSDHLPDRGTLYKNNLITAKLSVTKEKKLFSPQGRSQSKR